MNTIVLLISLLLPPTSHSMTIQVDNLKKANGDLIIMIYRRSDDFLGDDAYKSFTVSAKAPMTTTSISLPAGDYGVFVGHDVNGDGKVNQNFLGLPTEGVGVSQNKLGGLTKPSFDDCRINLTGDRNVRIRLVYY